MSEKKKVWRTNVKLGSIEESHVVPIGAKVVSVDKSCGEIVLEIEHATQPSGRAVEVE